MREIKIEKVVLNMGCGTKVNVEHAKKILGQVTGKKVLTTKTRKRSTFGVPKDKPIGCKVTVRAGASELLTRLFEATETIKESNFDQTGCLSFGVKEYIDVPGIEYEPSIGILGFDVCVSLQRPGFRVSKKSISSKIGKKHKITKEEAVEFIKNNFNVKVEK